MREISPCKNCPDRQAACHDTCEKYKEWLDRYHAQQQHFEDNRYRMNVQMSPARAKAIKTYNYTPRKFKGGDQ